MQDLSIDTVDLSILQYLIEDGTRSHKDIGQLVHLTGQAVGARVRKLQDIGVIEGYTVRWNPEKLGFSVQAFITIFLTSNQAHTSFHSFIKNRDEVVEAFRVSGEGCYWMRVRAESPSQLNDFLEELLKYANYKVSLTLGQIK
ncbi:transcriptional regulator [Paenibacillus selenitireducens]|uniref:Transcriptional regulator n=1 Tax=Paenibacillus selenitireducens TaxID=1324314 RepID=A0A1T2X1Z4_9BACL|nr:Lrp/AsnC family transcriptional regulator [Paenibacillus selenitireducens]OPA73911.1 transcriptional regulator [Paenibacillus selenitireducens]